MTLTTLVDYLKEQKKLELPNYSIPASNTDPLRQAFSEAVAEKIKQSLEKHGGFFPYGEGLLLEAYFKDQEKTPPTIHHFFSEKNPAIEALFKKPKSQRPIKISFNKAILLGKRAPIRIEPKIARRTNIWTPYGKQKLSQYLDQLVTWSTEIGAREKIVTVATVNEPYASILGNEKTGFTQPIEYGIWNPHSR